MARASFATAINCMDGRTQFPVNAYLRATCGVDYVDTITEPGPNLILCTREDAAVLESMRRRVAISVTRHGSCCIAIVGHHDCAGNPADERTQQDHTRAAIATVRSWGLDAEVIGLWVDATWTVHPVA